MSSVSASNDPLAETTAVRQRAGARGARRGFTMNSAIAGHPSPTRPPTATRRPGILDPVAAPSGPRRAVAAIAATPVSFALAAACVAFLGWVETHGASTDPEILVRFGALERGRVWDGQPWRLLAAAFLHIGWVHLAWNIAFGVLACRLVERALGSVRLLVVYLASALGASAASLLGQDEIAAGASGPLFGVIGTILALHRRG